MKFINSIFSLFFILLCSSKLTFSQNFRIRLCVPDAYYEDCLQMSDNVPGTFSCINARDKFECMTLIDRDEADIVNLDAEDLYLAGRLYELEPFAMEEHNGNIHLERSAVVIPRTSRITSLGELRGKRACLGEYNQILKWNVPVGILLASETMVPDCRGELNSVERFFGESCAAGNWSSDPELDDDLKRSHAKLCSLCKDSFSLCSSNDMFSGSDGTLKCLVDGTRAEVAFTTVDIATEFFSRRPEEKDQYEFLCLDGSRMAITSRGCDWAKHPTNAFVIRKGRERNKEIYLRLLQQIFIRYSKLRPSWFDRSFVSSFSVTQLVSMPFAQSKWNKYLEFYMPSIEKPLHGCVRRNITFCLSKEGEMNKCQQLQKAAFARRIRPSIKCHQADSVATCTKLLNERRADLMVMSPDKFYQAAKYGSIQALAVERSSKARYGVAVVKSNSEISLFSSLKNKKSCHTGFGDLASWTVPIGALIQDEAIRPYSCNRAQVVVDYFAGSCVPGAADARVNPNGTGVEKLCQQCVGDSSGQHVCDHGTAERYSGEEGAFRCLIEGRGDVAFLSHDTVEKFTDGRSPARWAQNLKSSDYRLLCRNLPQQPTGRFLSDKSFDDILGARHMNGRPLTHSLISEYQRCHIARIPDPIVVTSMFTPHNVRLEALQLLNQLSDSFLSENAHSFRLAGIFRNRSDLIFSDSAIKLQSLRTETAFEDALGEFLPILEQNDNIACSAIKSVSSLTASIVFIIVLFFVNS